MKCIKLFRIVLNISMALSDEDGSNGVDDDSENLLMELA